MITNQQQGILYQKGDIITCPLCRRDHYRFKQDVSRHQPMDPMQIEALDPEVLNPAFSISEKCQFCHGGWVVGLIQKVEGR